NYDADKFILITYLQGSRYNFKSQETANTRCINHLRTDVYFSVFQNITYNTFKNDSL
ncbi:hypothetical protein X975_01873, partial [Stegodyphus mimosarum]